MDQLAGPICEAIKCLYGCVTPQAAYVCDLEDNLNSLKDKWKDVKAMEEDVQRKVEEAENTRHRQRTELVNNWFQQIHSIQNIHLKQFPQDTIEKIITHPGKVKIEIEDIIDKGDQEIQIKCMCKCCPKNCVSSYKIGKKVSKLLKNVDELLTKGKSLGTDVEIAYKLPITTMEMPVDETVGMDLMVEKVWKSIEEESVSVIGLYGMGGAGKTTLLKRINNVFDSSMPKFDVVMWVVVSKELNYDSIMDNIRKKIGIEDHIWGRYCSKDEKAAEIHQVLKTKKFVLLLDDIWEQVDLKMVGVPNAKDTNFQSKVLFTTRSEDVCYKMQAQRKFKVECLTEKEAFELFCMKVGGVTLQSHPGIRKVARDMAAECKGLPLALIVVGSAMAGVKSLEEWEHSKNNLAKSSDVETNVFSILKFSYDQLPDEAHKKCFLYCALYPEDYEIPVSELIDRWTWEGFLDKDTTKSLRDIRNHGESVIGKLKRSCLLESVEDDLFLDRTIKMHDVIRDMALWLLHDEGKNNRKIIVQEDALKMSRHDAETWKTVEKISVMDCVEFPFPVTSCPNLTTLVYHDQTRRSLDLSNVHYMSRLKVLELRCGSFNLKLRAEIGSLVHFEYLSLDGQMYVSEFPMELKNLRKLKYFALYVSGGDLASIPSEVIANLEQLRVLIFYSKAKGESGVEREFLESVESLQHLEDLRIPLRSKSGVMKLLESTKLHTCVSDLSLEFMETEIDVPLLLASMSKMKQLRAITFDRLKFVQDSRVSDTCYLSMLQDVRIDMCDKIIHLTWLKYAPLLQFLRVYECKSMEEVIKGGREEEKGRDDENINDLDQNVFSSLVVLRLEGLPKLESIHNRALCFPSLRSLEIRFGSYITTKKKKPQRFIVFLKRKKFVLLLDDIWEKVDLKMVGVPNPKVNKSQSKVLFTTRYEDVCDKMQAQKNFKVECLSEEKAFELFCMKVGEETLQSHREISNLARDMAAECKGLPLALVVVGSAMDGVKSLGVWKYSKQKLTSSSWTTSGLESVFSVLKFSYDLLPDEIHRNCFLYCALYQEDYEIPVCDLIDQWISDGFLGEVTSKSIEDLRDLGECVIEKLKHSCLLESAENDLFLYRTIKMHDMIHDMALWLARDQDKNKNKILVLGESSRLVSQDGVETCKVVERVSTIDYGELFVPVANCPQLTTLMFRNKRDFGKPYLLLSNVNHMSKLKVLHLSCGETISLLVPVEMGCLVHLEYLSLEGAMYESDFPTELKNLRKLKYLSLNVIQGDLISIPLEVISNLEELRVLRFLSCFSTRFTREEEEFLEKLESLQHLEELEIFLRTGDGVMKFLESTKLQSCVKFLDADIGGFSMQFLEYMSKTKKLQEIRITYCPRAFTEDSLAFDMFSLSMLRKVHISWCHEISHLTWLKYVPLLQVLSITECDSLEELIKGETEDEKGRENIVDQNIFSSLVELKLGHLPKLKRIHNTPLCFASYLRAVVIRNCPNLKKVPFNSNTAMHKLKVIIGEQEWWDNLEWEDQTIKHKFHSKLSCWA